MDANLLWITNKVTQGPVSLTRRSHEPQVRLDGADPFLRYCGLPNSVGISNHMENPNQTPRPAIEQTLEAFVAFQQRLMSVHAPEFAALDLTMAQAKLLYVVTAAGELTMSEIAQRLGVTISTASGAVDHLVGLGLISRNDDPANRRQVRVSTTTVGQDMLEQLRELSTRQLRALFDVLNDDDLAVIERAARLMTRAVGMTSSPASQE